MKYIYGKGFTKNTFTYFSTVINPIKSINKVNNMCYHYSMFSLFSKISLNTCNLKQLSSISSMNTSEITNIESSLVSDLLQTVWILSICRRLNLNILDRLVEVGTIRQITAGLLLESCHQIEKA